MATNWVHSGIYVMLLLICVTTFNIAESKPVKTEEDILDYFKNYHYMDSEEDGNPGAERMKDMIIKFQYMAGLNQSGELDNETMKMMNTDRCGVADDIGSTSAKRRKRYVLQGSRWGFPYRLTYNYNRFSTKLNSNLIKQIMQRAFKFWSDVTPVTFREISSSQTNNHLELIWAPGEHGDRSPFDGPSGTLAHAYYPRYGGDIHFDDAESWTDGTSSGTNLLQVATHEIGHSLGLAHSNDRNAVMYAFYRGYLPNFELNQDDINGVQRLYGSKPGVPATTRPPAATPPPATTVRPNQPATTTTRRTLPSICNNAKVDAIVVVNGVTYAFSGLYYYVLTSSGIQNGYPQRISSRWTQLSGGVDAALYFDRLTNNDTPHLFFFKGDRYWRYSNLNQLDAGYPRSISSGFPGLPNDLDAAFVWPGNDQTYFFKGSQYYRYTRGTGVDSGYPRPVTVWRGLPSSGIDAAFSWINGRTYFFNDAQYYRFNDARIQVDSGGYPRPTGIWWFGCSSSAPLNEMSDASDARDQYEVAGNEASAALIHSNIGFITTLLAATVFTIL